MSFQAGCACFGGSGLRLRGRSLIVCIGGLLSRDGTVWRVEESVPVEVVDTVGAGDCFLAGLLVALLRRERASSVLPEVLDDGLARQVLAHALASATLCVMQRGAVPPTWDEVRARVTRFPCRFA